MVVIVSEIKYLKRPRIVAIEHIAAVSIVIISLLLYSSAGISTEIRQLTGKPDVIAEGTLSLIDNGNLGKLSKGKDEFVALYFHVSKSFLGGEIPSQLLVLVRRNNFESGQATMRMRSIDEKLLELERTAVDFQKSTPEIVSVDQEILRGKQELLQHYYDQQERTSRQVSLLELMRKRAALGISAIQNSQNISMSERDKEKLREIETNMKILQEERKNIQSIQLEYLKKSDIVIPIATSEPYLLSLKKESKIPTELVQFDLPVFSVNSVDAIHVKSQRYVEAVKKLTHRVD